MNESPHTDNIDPANWKRSLFKGNKVWIAVDEKGDPRIRNGKVLIKYRLDQDYEYWVHQDNIMPINSENLEKSAALKKKTQKSGKKTRTEIKPEDADKTVIIYTDGASSGNPGPSGIGVVMRYKEHEKEVSEYIGIATNNIAELEAIRTGLSIVKRKDLPVRLYTDSGYALGMLTKGWKARTNEKLIASILELMSEFTDLKLIKIKGHAGHDGNEKADALATSAVQKCGSA